MNTQNLLQVDNTGKVKGLILTLKGEPGGQIPAFDFYSRYFAPWVGVAEDPVTGIFIYLFFCRFRAAPAAYVSSKARGQIKAVAAGHSHSSTGSELRL